MFQTFQGLGTAMFEEIKILRVLEVCKKMNGLTKREKDFLFNYVRQGDLPVEQRRQDQDLRSVERVEDYNNFVVAVLDSIFHYQYLPRLHQALNSESSVDNFQSRMSQQNEWTHDSHTQKQSHEQHYWDYVGKEFTHLESVQYVNQFHAEDPTR
jgi:hypothetical protein